jgi:hypothetical protein
VGAHDEGEVVGVELGEFGGGVVAGLGWGRGGGVGGGHFGLVVDEGMVKYFGGADLVDGDEASLDKVLPALFNRTMLASIQLRKQRGRTNLILSSQIPFWYRSRFIYGP